jgi:MFS transporter, DHA1 family, inner membrane transport protein
LALSTFGLGLAEFAVMGVLPNIASSLGVSIPDAGHLVSAYAVGVVVGAPLLAGAGFRLSPKHLLVGLMVLFTAGNLLSALAPNFDCLICARFVAGLPHGAVFGAGAVVAARLAPAGREGRAVASLLMGLTIANIAGVPATTVMGQSLGWRVSFIVISVIGAVAAFGLAVLVPRQAGGQRGNLKAELHAFRNRQVLLLLATALFGFAGVFATYAFLASIITEVTRLPQSAVPWILALSGIGMTIGVTVSGPLTDRSARATTYLSLIGLATVLVAFYFGAHIAWLAALLVFLLCVTGFLMDVPIQTMVIRYAADAPILSSASIHSAFNLANAGGVWLGGLAIAAGRGWMSSALTGAALSLTGLAVAVTAGCLERRDRVPELQATVLEFLRQ